jgi:hypothetical protein
MHERNYPAFRFALHDPILPFFLLQTNLGEQFDYVRSTLDPIFVCSLLGIRFLISIN